MPVPMQDLEAAVAVMDTAMTRAETVGAAVAEALSKQAEAIVAAVEADNAIDAANTARVKALVETINTRMTSNTDKLEKAALANTPNA